MLSLKFRLVFVIQQLFQLEQTMIRCRKRNVTAAPAISRLDRIHIFILIIRHPGSGFHYASKFGHPGESAATPPPSSSSSSTNWQSSEQI